MAGDTAFRSEESFTQEEFRQWLDERPSADLNHYELLNGRIVMTPPAGWPHGRIGSNLNYLLRRHVTERKLGIVLDASTGFDLPSGDTVEPDVSFVSAARLSAGPMPERGNFLRIVPSLVVEILSQSTAKRDRTEKKEIYARNGVDEYWIVDADRGELTVFALEKGAYAPAVSAHSGPIPSVLFPNLDARVEDLFDG
jgi:Uma2 family endonuclease